MALCPRCQQILLRSQAGWHELLNHALQVPAEERAALAGELIESLRHGVNPENAAQWATEIRDRVATLECGETRSSP